MAGWKTRRGRGGQGSGGSASFPAELLVTEDGGPLSRLMAETDWPTTLLGPFPGWPPELRTAVGICLNCPFPILVMWGPELRAIAWRQAHRRRRAPGVSPAPRPGLG